MTSFRVDLEHPDQYTHEWLSSDVNNLIKTLRQCGCDPVETKPGHWRCICPMHDDTRPSLYISPGDKRPWVAHCHACGGGYVGLICHIEQRFEYRRFKATNGAERVEHGKNQAATEVPGRPVAGGVRETYGSGANGAATRAAEAMRPDGVRGAGARTVRYRTTLVNGDHYDHVRTDGPDGKKIGGMPWEPTLPVKLSELPLYGWQALADWTGPVILCEGEHAAHVLGSRLDTVRVCGTVCGAASVPSDDTLRALLPNPVITWEDNDDAGRTHMARIAHALRRLGHTSVSRIVWGDQPKDDAADAVARKADLQSIVASATVWPDIVDQEFVKAVTKEVERLRVRDAARDQYDTECRGPRPTIESRIVFGGAYVDRPRPEWLIDDLLARGQVAGVFGAPGSLKSFFVLDLCLSTLLSNSSLGSPISAGDAPVVMYVAAEGADGTWGRVDSWLSYRRIKPADLPDRWCVVTEPPNLSTDTGCQDFYDLCKYVHNRFGKLTLWALDTVSACLPGAEESNETMSRIVELSKAINRDLGSSGILVHHSGKDEDRGPRGGSAFGANIDAVFHAVANEDSIRSVRTDDGKVVLSMHAPTSTITCQKQRNAPKRAPIVVTLTTVAGQADPVLVLSDRPAEGTPKPPRDPDIAGRRRLPGFLRWLRDHPGILPSQIADKYGCNKNMSLTLVRLAVEENEAHQHELVTRGVISKPLYHGPAEKFEQCHDGPVIWLER